MKLNKLKVVSTFIFVLSAMILNAQVVITDSLLNLYSPGFIETSDDGYLYNTIRNRYTPNSTPIENVDSYKVHKLDNSGDITWSLQHDFFSPKHMYETSEGDFISINGKFTGNFYTCGGSSSMWGSSIYFSKINGEGQTITSFEFNPGCQNFLGDVLEVESNRYVISTASLEGFGSNLFSDGHLILLDEEGNIMNEVYFPGTSLRRSNMFIDQSNNINLIFLNQGVLTLNRYNSDLEVVSSVNYTNFFDLFPASTSNIETEVVYDQVSDNLLFFYRYRMFNVNSDYRLKTLQFNSDLEINEEYDYIISRNSSKIVKYNNLLLLGMSIESEITDFDTKIYTLDYSGLIVDSFNYDYFTEQEIISDILINSNDEILISGYFNCCNLEEEVGPGKSFLSIIDVLSSDSQIEIISNYINVFPNPTSGIIKIDAPEFDLQKIDVYDIRGKILSSNVVNGSTYRLDLSHLNNGMYHLILVGNKGDVGIKRVVVGN